ncbi:MAG: hypothetical protein DI535_05925 [Citrobacter freundii]|nr:MAG: hypothetical protein DI535_05925 [Citrobacter freundii]
MERTYSYEAESYAVFTNLDSSILLLNPLLETFGFRFVRFRLDELEKSFGHLFGISTDYQQPIATITDSEPEMTEDGWYRLPISNNFYELLAHGFHGGHYLIHRREMFFLQKIENAVQHVKNGYITFDSISYRVDSMKGFTQQLIYQLRLLKRGDVSCTSYFQIAVDTRTIISRLGPAFVPIGNSMYTLSENDVNSFKRQFNSSLSISMLAEVAFHNFNTAYEITEPRAKFLMLMTCLEALFSAGRTEIAHTISRHLSMLFAKSPEEFQASYKSVKNLYNVRSKIIHGDNVKNDLHPLLLELEDLVRRALNHCLSLNLSKDAFYQELNAKGF